MGSCCSCLCTDSIPDNHPTKFKVTNVDDEGHELGSGVMELTQRELILHTHKRDAVRWPYLCLRRYGFDSNLFSFESGRRCHTGQGIFAFKCSRAEEIFNLLQDLMQCNSINVVEEPVVITRNSQPSDRERARSPQRPTSLGYTGLPNGFHSFPGESLSFSAARHPSVSSLRHSSVGEDSTHPLLGPEEQEPQLLPGRPQPSGLPAARRGEIRAGSQLRLPPAVPAPPGMPGAPQSPQQQQRVSGGVSVPTVRLREPQRAGGPQHLVPVPGWPLQGGPGGREPLPAPLGPAALREPAGAAAGVGAAAGPAQGRGWRHGTHTVPQWLLRGRRGGAAAEFHGLGERGPAAAPLLPAPSPAQPPAQRLQLRLPPALPGASTAAQLHPGGAGA
ncbi:PREDICTED: fibroblast growth factor receptor substrate 3 isoform X2 [Pseudopodoces humilis]|uniref:fibroblast growth factor receptor substrate 3 isoform X2 n=1 Tax=Pseudopodoces humilis TaxID=181119 RepID=UPI0006B79023|nr:PREDICTED: fibroblast growth factor receptor substrate 3 isoform X2 [Pseudopodoces humilis]